MARNNQKFIEADKFKNLMIQAGASAYGIHNSGSYGTLDHAINEHIKNMISQTLNMIFVNIANQIDQASDYGSCQLCRNDGCGDKVFGVKPE